MRLIALPLLLITALPGAAYAADRDGARTHMISGVKNLYAGNLRTARIDLLNAIKDDEDWALPHAVQARIYLALGDGVAAESELRRAMKNGMAESQISHLRLHSWLLQGDPDRVLRIADNAYDNRYSVGYEQRVRAGAAIARGDFQRAAQNFDAALRFTPLSTILWTDIGRFRQSGGNVGGAVQAANRAVDLSPRNVGALILMAGLVREQYGLVAALPWYDRVLEIDPKNLPAMVQTAATLGDAGRATEMLAMTRRILAIDQTNADAWFLQAVLAARANKPDLARNLLYRTNGKIDALPAVKLLRAVLDLSTGNSEQAISQLEDLVKAQPDNLKARRLLGAAMWRAGNAKSAIAILDPVARRADADSYTLSIIGRAYEDAGNRDTAAVYLDRAASPVRGDPAPFNLSADLNRITLAGDVDPNNADVAIPRLAQLINSGRAREALESARRLRELNPGTPAANVLVGDALMALSNPAEAATAYKQAANVSFNEPIALRYISALKQSGQEAAALRVLDLFLSQNPRNISAMRLAADHFMETAQWDSAISTLEGIRTRIGNRDASILNSLAWAWFEKGDRRKAINYATAAYAIASSNPALASSYGWMLYRSGNDKPRGTALMQKAVGIAPALPLLRYQLAQALIDQGKIQAARDQLNAALSLPNFVHRKEAEALLASL